MGVADRWHYYRRIFDAYLLPSTSQLSFWHDRPQQNFNSSKERLGEYYMLFAEKADYTGAFDALGIPMLDYHGRIGRQYNPIAIAQWGLGNHDLFRRSGGSDKLRRGKFLNAADWLLKRLERNNFGVFVWNHDFDWEYRTRLNAPWYSGLAQGQGISLLVRAAAETQSPDYMDAAHRAFESFIKPVNQGGVTFVDERNQYWFEEYIVSPPTHILNGFIWASWGIYDYFLATQNGQARDLFDHAVATLKSNIDRYDFGFWSLYEQSGTRLPMLASAFYHRLHIVQLRVMHFLTRERIFAEYANRWEAYSHSRMRRMRAFCCKAAFKILYY
ncbi:MAG: D-glucuronyl C5-epimerase family protein [Terriglobales bacterium]